jgi:phage-related protein
MSAVIKVSIVAAAANAIKGLTATGKSTDQLQNKVQGLDRSVKKLDGRKATVTFDPRGFASGTAQIVAAGLALDALRHGLPDLSFGIETMATKMAIALGAVLSLTGAVLPLAGAIAAVGAAAATAGLGLGLFGAVAFPTISTVTKAVQEYNTAAHAFARAKALGDTKAMKTAADNMKSALAVLTPAQRKSANAVLGMQDAWQRLSASVAPTVLKILTVGATALAKIIPKLSPAIDAVAKAVSGISSSAFEGLVKSTQPLVDLIVGDGVPAIKSFASILGSLALTGLHFIQAFAPVGNVVNKATDSVATALAKFDFKPLAAFVSNLLPLIGDLFKQFGGLGVAVVKLVVPLAGPVLTAATQILDILKKAFSEDVMKAFIDDLVKVIAAIAPLAAIIVPLFAKFAALVGGQLVSIMPKLIPLIGDIANQFVNVVAGISPLVPALLDLVKAAVDLIPVLFPIVTALRDALLPIIVALGPAITALAPTLRNDLIEVFKALGPALLAIVPVLPPLIISILDLIVAITPLLPVVSQLIVMFAGDLTDALIALTPIIQDTATWIAKTFDAKELEGIHKWLGSMTVAIGILGAVITTILKGLTFVHDVFKSMGETFYGIANFIGGVFGSLWRTITGFVSGMTGLGASIANGLINGLQSAWSFVMSKIQGLVGLIPKAIQNLLGIHSASRVTFGLGVHTGGGMALGIESQIPRVQNALRGLTSLPALGSSGAQLTGSGSTVVNNYFTVEVPVSSDPAAVGREVRRVLAEANRVDGLG